MANSISGIAENIQIFGMLVLSQLRAKLALVGYVNNFYPGAADPSSHGSIVNIPSLAISGSARTRAVNGAVTVDDFSSANVAVTLQQVYKAVKVDNLQRTFSNVAMFPQLASRLAIQLADGVDSQLTTLWSAIPYEVGSVDGTSAFSSTLKLTTLAAARRVLETNKAPTDRLQAVIGPAESYNIRALDLYNQANTWGNSQGRATGDLGNVAGFAVRTSQSTVSTATLATTSIWGTPLVNNVAGYAIGVTSIAIDGLGAGTLPKGSVFQLGGFNYSVTADATITSNAATISINPPLQAAAADEDALTFSGTHNGILGGHSAAGSVGFAYDPDAFITIVRPQADFMPQSGIYSQQFSDPDSGLTFRLSFQSTLSGAGGTAMQEIMVGDILVGTQLVRPDLAVRISGQVG